MPHFSLSAIGTDRPGIVAAVTAVLMEQGCNLEDSTMTILRGQFAIMLVVAAPPDTDAVHLEAALAPVATELDLVIVVREMPEAIPPAPSGSTWAVSVHGADRPGIVHSVTSALSEAGANVIDLATRVVGKESDPVYAMVMTVTVPPTTDPGSLGAMLEELAGQLGVHCTMHSAEADIL